MRNATKNVTLIGTTDLNYQGDPKDAQIDSDEINYLCELINHYFSHPICAEDIIWQFSGVRPLLQNEGKAHGSLSREYHLQLDAQRHATPLISIFGGKLTTHRILAEDTANMLMPFFSQMTGNWTANTPYPGGDFTDLSKTELIDELSKQLPELNHQILARYVAMYGTEARQLLVNKQCIADLGQHFGAGLYAHEINYLIEHEWAHTTEDILWRRSKLGLFLSRQQIAQVDVFVQQATTA